MDAELFATLNVRKPYPCPTCAAEAELYLGADCMFTYAGDMDLSPLFDIVQGVIVGATFNYSKFLKDKTRQEGFKVEQWLCYTKERRKGHDGTTLGLHIGKPTGDVTGHWFCHDSGVYVIGKIGPMPDLRFMRDRETLVKERILRDRKRALELIERLKEKRDKKHYPPEPAEVVTQLAKLTPYLGRECAFTFLERSDVLKTQKPENLSYGRIVGVRMRSVDLEDVGPWLCRALDQNSVRGHDGGDRGGMSTLRAPLIEATEKGNWWCNPREVVLFKPVVQEEKTQLLLPLLQRGRR